MICPFPGMDPWLEAPQEWPGFHDTLVIKTVEVLQPRLRERGYYAKPGERVWLSQSDHAIVPDIAVMPKAPRVSAQGAAEAAVLDVDEPQRVARGEFEVHEGFVDIYRADDHVLVTCLEYLSPSNKGNSEGRELYQRKQRALADEGVHLVEIDLLRAGRHALDIPLWVVDQYRPWDYLVNLARRESKTFEFYHFLWHQKLPRIRLPLKTGDADIALDLQDVFARSYDISPYPDRLDYSKPPEPPLSKDEARRASEWLRAHGLI